MRSIDGKKKVTLRNGTRVTVRFAVIAHATISSYFSENPNHFKIIRDLALGRELQEPDGEALLGLQKEGFVSESRELNHNLKSVFISSYRDTADGETLIDPFAPATAEERVDLAQFREWFEHRVTNWRNYVSGNPDEQSNDQGRRGP